MMKSLLFAAALPLVAFGAGCAAKKAAVQAPAHTTAAVPTPKATATAPAATATTAQDGDEASRPETSAAAALPPLAPPVVSFAFDSEVLTPAGRAALDAFADAWRAHGRQGTLVIAGHADERGTDEYNLVLGQKRASAVRRYLADLGVDGDTLRTVSYGEHRPADPTPSEDAFARNRRAEVVVEGRL